MGFGRVWSEEEMKNQISVTSVRICVNDSEGGCNKYRQSSGIGGLDKTSETKMSISTGLHCGWTRVDGLC